jgi:cytoskeletal protein RodZ
MEASNMVVLVGTCFLCVFFLIAGILGLFNWKNIQNQSFERGFILFMLLLPIFIRF